METASQLSFRIGDTLLNGANKQELIANPVAFVAHCMRILNTEETWASVKGAAKKDMLLQALDKVANGKDGVAGTEDDVLPAAFVDAVKLMLERNLVSQMIDVIADAAKGRFDAPKAKEVVVHGCIPFVKSWIQKRKL